MSARAKVLRLLAALFLSAAGMLAATMPASGQTEDEGPTLPDSYLEAYGWWSKLQQNPAGGRITDPPGCTAYPVTSTPPPTSTTLPTNPNTAPAGQCPVGPPADGLYIAYDYETVTPTAASGAIGNAPTSTTTTLVLPPPPDPRIPPSPNVYPPDSVLGPTAYSAVRYVVPENAETSLNLQVINRPTTTPGGLDPTAGVKVLACQITTSWTGVVNDRYDQGPKYDPSSCSVGELIGDTLTFTLSGSMAETGYIDVAIVPSFGDCPDPPSSTPSTSTTTMPPGTPGVPASPPKCDHPYQLAFAKPLDYSLSLDSVPEDEEALSDDELADLALDEDFLDEDFFDDGALDPESAFADFDFAGAGVDNYGALAGAPTSRPVIARAVPTSGFRNPFGPDATRGERLLAVLLLLAMGAALWWFGGQQLRAPRLLGSLGGGGIPVVGDRERERNTNGGLGRFARPRGSSRPPRLF